MMDAVGGDPEDGAPSRAMVPQAVRKYSSQRGTRYPRWVSRRW